MVAFNGFADALLVLNSDRNDPDGEYNKGRLKW